MLPLAAEIPEFPMRRVADVWLRFFGIEDSDDRWQSIDLDLLPKIAGVLCMLASLYRKGALNTLGTALLMLAQSRAGTGEGVASPLAMQWHHGSGELRFRIAATHE